MKILSFICVLFLSVLTAVSQTAEKPKADGATGPEVLAKAAFSAHGGESLGALKTLSMTGSVDITSSAASQAIPATFAQVFSGEKYRLEVDGGFIKFLQINDGVNTFTAPSRGFELPPINRIGLMLLASFGKEGFTVSELSEKRKIGFRMTSPEGFYTDFYLDKKTNRIASYDASYVVAGRAVKTFVEIDKFEEIEGLVIPSKFAQKFEMSGMTVYALFKSKQIGVNKEISNDVFAL